MTANYSRAYLLELRDALEQIARPGALIEESEITVEALIRTKRAQASGLARAAVSAVTRVSPAR
jgi:hypothetical protein